MIKLISTRSLDELPVLTEYQIEKGKLASMPSTESRDLDASVRMVELLAENWKLKPAEVIKIAIERAKHR